MQESLFYTSIAVFYWKNKYLKVLNGDVHETSTGLSCRTSRGPNDGMLLGRPVMHVFSIQLRNILNLP